jgi:hypothetical protein
MCKDNKALIVGVDRASLGERSHSSVVRGSHEHGVRTYDRIELVIGGDYYAGDGEFGTIEDDDDPPVAAEGYWRTAKGTVIKIEEMNTGHLHNAYRMFDRGGSTENDTPKMRELGYEIRKRNIKMLAP